MNYDLPEKFIERMRRQLKGEEEFSAFLSSYDRPPHKGLRVNTLKISPSDFSAISPFGLTSVPWEKNGFYVAEEKIGRHPYHFAGLYYSQEPSAMSVVPLLDAQPGDRVLDLCAAPGGKSTQIAQALAGKGLLVCNEIDSSRAAILSQNIERLGVKNAVVVSASPQFLSGKFPLFFDKILVDAPCSGEGMFKKNAKEAFENWSEENVAACAARQKEILCSAAEMLGGGGRLVYSTCTFAPEEDEEQVARFLAEHDDFSLVTQNKLYPHERAGEGHFYAVLQKAGTEARGAKPIASNLSKKEREFFDSFCAETLTAESFSAIAAGVLYRAGTTLYRLPDESFPLEKLPVLRAGIRLGEFMKNRFEPGHALAMALQRKDVFRTVDLSKTESEKYLRGETLQAETENGWCLVTVDSFPLGWGKTTNGVVKNHLPKGLRLLR